MGSYFAPETKQNCCRLPFWTIHQRKMASFISPKSLTSQKSMSLQLSTDGELNTLDKFLHPWKEEIPSSRYKKRQTNNRRKSKIRRKTIVVSKNKNRLRQIFDEVDHNGQGTLTLEKFAEASKHLQLGTSNSNCLYFSLSLKVNNELLYELTPFTTL